MRKNTNSESRIMNTEPKWLQQHGIRSVENIAMILGALTQLESGRYAGSSKHKKQYQLAHQLSQFKQRMSL